ncbi:MAG: hypothetical protein KC503_33305 [Myxococcales bacterium]|nr:hypothetical protein [Myxococcales bacterium]
MNRWAIGAALLCAVLLSHCVRASSGGAPGATDGRADGASDGADDATRDGSTGLEVTIGEAVNPSDGPLATLDSSSDFPELDATGPCGSLGNVCCASGSGTTCNSTSLVCLENKTCSCVGRIVGGGDSQCAGHPGGTATCWGSNSAGQLALTSAITVAKPTMVTSIPGKIFSFALGNEHGCAVIGTPLQLYCWGANPFGQAGHDLVGSDKPILVVIPGDAQRVAAGFAHTCAINNKNQLYCWGNNFEGQLSAAVTDMETSKPTLLAVQDVVDVGLGRFHTCAATKTSVQCWGRNSEGQLGAGNFGNTAAVVTVGLGAAQQITAGARHTCALRNNEVYCWGDNAAGQVGVPGNTRAASPQLVAPLLLKARRVVAGLEHTCAIRVDGVVFCWGGNGAGQSSPSSSLTTIPTPTQVPGIQGAVDLALGSQHTCALTLGGEVRCWGDGGKGQLGGGIAGLPGPTTVAITCP